MGIIHNIANTIWNGGIVTWDTLLVFLNLLLPNKAIGNVVPKGHPGYKGEWPEYIPRKDTDSRCSCPAINALANHGIIAHDGRNIKFTELTNQLRNTYNVSPTFSRFIPNFAAEFMHKSYGKGTFDLEELDLHNEGIEHDGSLCRDDAYHVKDQSIIAVPVIEDCLGRASGKDANGDPLLLPADLSAALSQRYADCKATNPEYKLDFGHKVFACGNATTMLAVFGGRVNDLRAMLLEERIPEGWEPRIRSRYGYTMGAFNVTVFRVLFGLKGVSPKTTTAATSTL